MNKNFLYLVAFLIICICSVAFPQWLTVDSGTNANLRSISFINENVGWIAGDNILLHTTDQGEIWNEKPLPGIHNSIFFYDEQTGWVCSEFGEIFKTTDGGANWLPKVSGTNNALKSIRFINELTGFAVGFFQTVLMTTDGGETWAQMLHSGTEHFLSSSLINNQKIFVAGTNGSIFISNDTGQTWDSVNVGMPNGLYSIEFINVNTGFIFGCCGSYFKTTDGGLTWEDRGYITTGDILFSSFFVNEFTGWTVGEIGWLLKTTDGGENWFENSPQISSDLYDVTFIDDNIGFIAGANGVILKTINAGGSSTFAGDGRHVIPDKFLLHQNYPNPFNPATSMQYAISSPPDGETGRQFVSLKVYDVLGREVATLVNEYKEAGKHSVEFNATGLPSGVYFYRFNAGSFSETKKMILLK